MAKKERRAEAKWNDNRERWELRPYKNGKPKMFTSSDPTKRGKREVEARADEWLESSIAEIRFKAAWEKFLENQEKSTSRSNYIKTESLGRLWILPNISNCYIHDITPNMWRKCVDAPYDKKKLSRRTCKNVQMTISAFINYARRERWKIDKLERGDIILPKQASVGKRDILHPEALKTLFSKACITKYGRDQESIYIHAWRLGVVLGLRRGEIKEVVRANYDRTVEFIDVPDAEQYRESLRMNGKST